MASLKDQLEAAGYDASGLNEADLLQKLENAGYDVSQFSAPSIAEQNLHSLSGRGPLDDLKSLFSDTGKDARAGYAGVGDLVAGNGIQIAASNVERAEEDKPATTPAANMGSQLGSFFTPAQIAIQAGLGAAFAALGPALSGLLDGWGAKAAVNAVGKIKKIADMLGVKNLDNLGKFLLTPLELGGKEFGPIVTATSSPQDMLGAAQAIKAAAGAQLETVAAQADKAVQGAGEMGGVSYMIDLPALKAEVAAMRDEIKESVPNLGKAVVNQYEAALADIEKNIDKVTSGNTDKVFSAFSRLKTTIGDLVYKHGSPLESKAALNDVYHALSGTLDQTATNVGGEIAAAYRQANTVYHQISAVVEALEGRAANAAKLFDAPAFLAALTGGLAGMSHGPLGAIAAPLSYAAARVAENYGPQAIAAGLNAAPALGPVVQTGLRAVPVAGNALVRALYHKQNE